jgi:hypothetical protein
VVERPVVNVLAEQHYRRGVHVPAQVGPAQAQGAEDQAVEQLTPIAAVQQLPLTARVAVGLLDHDRVGVPPGLGDDQPGQLRKVRRGQLGHGQPDHPGAAPPQVARGLVGLVAELVDGALDAFAQLVGDQRELVDDVRDRPG